MTTGLARINYQANHSPTLTLSRSVLTPVAPRFRSPRIALQLVYNSEDISSTYPQNPQADDLLELIEFSIYIPTMWLASCHQATWGKLLTSKKRVEDEGLGWFKDWHDVVTNQWGLEGKLPRWFVQELAALAQGELKEYYRHVRQFRKHPTNQLSARYDSDSNASRTRRRRGSAKDV